MKKIRINGDLYAYTDILAKRPDAFVVEVDDEDQEVAVLEKEEVHTEPPASTETPERAAKRKSAPAPVVTVQRGGVDTGGTGLKGEVGSGGTGLKADAEKALKQETAVAIPTGQQGQ